MPSAAGLSRSPSQQDELTAARLFRTQVAQSGPRSTVCLNCVSPRVLFSMNTQSALHACRFHTVDTEPSDTEDCHGTERFCWNQHPPLPADTPRDDWSWLPVTELTQPPILLTGMPRPRECEPTAAGQNHPSGITWTLFTLLPVILNFQAEETD